MKFAALGELMTVFFALLAIVILFKPILISILGLLFGYEKRAVSLTAFSLGQVSEFSLIIAAVALSAGLIGAEIFSLTVLLVAVSIVTTTYTLKVEGKIYAALSWFYDLISKLLPENRKPKKDRPVKKDVVMFGCHRMGMIFLQAFKKLKKRVLVIDNNPKTINALERTKVNCIYGNLSNEQILKRAGLSNTDLIVSTVRVVEDNLMMINFVKEHKYEAKIIVVAEHIHQALDLYDAGADYVIVPHIVSGEKMSVLIKDILKGRKKLEKIKNKDINHLLFIEEFGKSPIK